MQFGGNKRKLKLGTDLIIFYALFRNLDLRLENSNQTVIGGRFHGRGSRETPKWKRASSADLTTEYRDGGRSAVKVSCRSDGAEGEGE